MPPGDLTAWERAGPMLAARRAQLSPRYANRREFARDTGLNWRTLHDAERARRANFKDETLRAFENAYRLVPGSLDRTLAGGGLEPAPAPEPPRPRLEVVPGPPALPDDPSDAEVETFILHQEGATLREILWRTWRTESIPRAVRVASVRAVAGAEAEASRPAEGRERRREPGA